MSNKNWDTLRHDMDVSCLPSSEYLIHLFQTLEALKNRCDVLEREARLNRNKYCDLIDALEAKFKPAMKSHMYLMDNQVEVYRYVAALTTKKTGKKKK
jgi:hypothetical protein